MTGAFQTRARHRDDTKGTSMPMLFLVVVAAILVQTCHGQASFAGITGTNPRSCGKIPYKTTVMSAPLVARELVVGNNTMYYVANHTRFPTWTAPTGLPMYQCINATKACTIATASNPLFANFINSKFIGDVGPAQRFISAPSLVHETGTAVCPLGYETGRGFTYTPAIMNGYGFRTNLSYSTSNTAANSSGNAFRVCNNHRFGVTRMQYVDPSTGQDKWAFYFKVDFGVTPNVTTEVTCGFNPTTTVNLGTAALYGVIASTTITNTGTTHINGGGVALSPGSAITGSPIVQCATHIDDSQAVTAVTDANSAFTQANAITPCTAISAVEMGSLTWTPGCYSWTGGAQITGAMTLNGPAGSTWVFKIPGVFTTATASSMVMTGGASACNVIFAVSSAAIGATSAIQGNVLASAAITMLTGATLTNGRLFSNTASVNLQGNTINVGQCTCGIGCPSSSGPGPIIFANASVSQIYLTGPFNTLTPTSKTWLHPTDGLQSRQMNFSIAPITPSAYNALVAGYTGPTSGLNALSFEKNVYHLLVIADTDLGNSSYQIVIEWSNNAYIENPDVLARQVRTNQATPYDLWHGVSGAVIPKYNFGVLPSYTTGFAWTDQSAQDGSLLVAKDKQIVYRLDARSFTSTGTLAAAALALQLGQTAIPSQVNTIQLASVYNAVNFTGDFPEYILSGLDSFVNACHMLGYAVLLETNENSWQDNYQSVLYRVNTGWNPHHPPTIAGQLPPVAGNAGYINPATLQLELSTPLKGAYAGLTAVELYHNWLIQYHHIDGIVHDAVPDTQVPIHYMNKTILPYYAPEVFLYHTLPMPIISVSSSYLPVYLINTTEATIYPCGVPSVYYYTDNGLNMLTGDLQPLGVPLFQGPEQLVNLQVLIPADIRAFSWLLFPLATGQTPLVPYSITLNSTSPYLTPTLQYPAPLSSVEWLAIWLTERMLNGQTPVVPQGFEQIIFTQGGLACFNLRYTVHPNFFHVDSFRWDITALRYTTHSPEYETIPMDDELQIISPPSIADGLKLSWTMYALPPLPIGVIRQDDQEGLDNSYSSSSSSDSSSYSSSFDEDIVVDCNCATSTDIYPPDTNDDGVGDYYPPACIIAQTNYLSSNQTHIMKFDNNDAIETAIFLFPLPNNTIPLVLGESDPPVCTIITITGARYYNCTMPPSSYILSLFNPTVVPIPSSSQSGLWPPYIWLTILLIFIVAAILLIVLIVMLRRTRNVTTGPTTSASYSRVW